MKRLLLTTLVLFLACSFWDTAAAAAAGYLVAGSPDEVVPKFVSGRSSLADVVD